MTLDGGSSYEITVTEGKCADGSRFLVALTLPTRPLVTDCIPERVHTEDVQVLKPCCQMNYSIGVGLILMRYIVPRPNEVPNIVQRGSTRSL